MWIRRKLYREAIQEHGVCNTSVHVHVQQTGDETMGQKHVAG